MLKIVIAIVKPKINLLNTSNVETKDISLCKNFLGSDTALNLSSKTAKKTISNPIDKPTKTLISTL